MNGSSTSIPDEKAENNNQINSSEPSAAAQTFSGPTPDLLGDIVDAEKKSEAVDVQAENEKNIEKGAIDAKISEDAQPASEDTVK